MGRGSNNIRWTAFVVQLCLVWWRQTHYALTNLLVGVLAIKGLGTYAWPARVSQSNRSIFKIGIFGA